MKKCSKTSYKSDNIIKKRIKSLIRGFLFSFLLTVPIALILSAAMALTDFPEEYLSPAVLITVALSIVLSGILTTAPEENLGWVGGSLAGFLYMAVITAVRWCLEGRVYMDKDIITEEVNAEYLKGFIYYVRGVRVMLDMDLAKIYGYSTKDFNRQVKNNIEKFEQDFMFQLTNEECEILRCKNSTSSWGGRRYNPYAFTEQGIYMLMTVLKGELATKQSKALIRIFKQMKDYIVDNQPLLGQREYLQLSLQTTQNTQDLLDLRKSLSAVDDKVASIIDTLGNVVTKSELANVMLDFSNPTVRRGWLILNGQPVESDLAYQQIYATAKKTIFVVDNYIGLKTLVLLKEVSANVKITVFSDNIGNRLHQAEFNDFCREYPDVSVSLQTSGGIFHDRYIVIDYQTADEQIYHCGASSKDGGNKVTTITAVTDGCIYHPVIDQLLNNPVLVLR